MSGTINISQWTLVNIISMAYICTCNFKKLRSASFSLRQRASADGYPSLRPLMMDAIDSRQEVPFSNAQHWRPYKTCAGRIDFIACWVVKIRWQDRHCKSFSIGVCSLLIDIISL
ncbi:hypothetical protein Ddc_08171 [Ditylenchus destructor]|nr:hypothetical protein Ddc_08171 [Ditylenchus destructor]